MAYTYSVSNKRIIGRNAAVTLVVSLDGAEIARNDNFAASDLTNERIALEASRIAEQHAAAVVALDAITEGKDVPATPDAYETVARPFFAAQAKLLQVQKATEQGLLKGTEQADAEVAFKEAYVAAESFMEKLLADPRYIR